MIALVDTGATDVIVDRATAAALGLVEYEVPVANAVMEDEIIPSNV